MPSIFKLDLKRFMVLVVLVLYDKITSGITSALRGPNPSTMAGSVLRSILKFGMTLALLIIIDDVDLLKRLVNCLILVTSVTTKAQKKR